MSNNKQQTVVDKAQELIDKMTMEIGEFNAKHCAMVCVDELIKNHGIQANLYLEFEQAQEMEVAGKEMSYADGYAEGYKRATELAKWGITKKIKG